RCVKRVGLIARWAQGNLRKLLRSDTPGARLEQSPVQNSSPSIDRGEEAALLATVAAWWTSASPTAQPLTAAGPPGLGVARAGAAGSTPRPPSGPCSAPSPPAAAGPPGRPPRPSSGPGRGGRGVARGWECPASRA